MTTSASLQPVDRRTRAVAALMMVPAVVAALGVLAVDAWRWQHPNAPLSTAPFAYSLADAIAADDVQGAYEFIRAGQDPNELIAVRHPVLTDGRSVLVSPFLWAVATQKRNALLMLLGYGARMDRATNRMGICLAEALGDADIARLLRSYADAVSPTGCPPRNASAPLLSVIEKADAAK